MLVRILCVLAFCVVFFPANARAGCAEDVSRLISKDTERLLSQYNRVTRRIEREGATANLRAEECRIARQLEPQLANQVAAMKKSRCRRDPSVANMLADIVQGHEEDLAVLRKVTTQPDCR
jgi:hypothetical protein